MNKEKHAIVLSGGGADGAYEVGVVKALVNGRSPATNYEPIEPAIFTGTSIGAFNAAFLVSQWDQYGAAAVGNLEKIWRDCMATIGIDNGAYRIRTNPFEWMDPRNFFNHPVQLLDRLAKDTAYLSWDGMQRMVNLVGGDEPMIERALNLFNLSSYVAAEPWERTLRKEVDYEKIRSSSRELIIAATNWALGEIRLFRNRDMTDKLGPRAIQASSAVPGFFPPVDVGAQTYVDGAVLMNTPLKPAILAGADVIHVIYMNTDVSKMPIEALDSTLETFYRCQIIAWASAVNADIKRAEACNKGLALLKQSASGEVQDQQIKTILEAAGPMQDNQARRKKYRPLTIHRYFPPDGLDGALGFLNLNRERIDRLIDEGFNHTVNYNPNITEPVWPDGREHQEAAP